MNPFIIEVSSWTLILLDLYGIIVMLNMSWYLDTELLALSF